MLSPLDITLINLLEKWMNSPTLLIVFIWPKMMSQQTVDCQDCTANVVADFDFAFQRTTKTPKVFYWLLFAHPTLNFPLSISFYTQFIRGRSLFWTLIFPPLCRRLNWMKRNTWTQWKHRKEKWWFFHFHSCIDCFSIIHKTSLKIM